MSQSQAMSRIYEREYIDIVNAIRKGASKSSAPAHGRLSREDNGSYRSSGK